MTRARAFMARREAIAPEQRNESGARLRRYGKTGLAHLLVNETNQIFFRVGVARERSGGLGAIASSAQRRVALEVAGLDQDAAIRRGRCNESFERGSKVARAGLYPDCPAAAEQWNRVGLVDEAGRLAAEIVALKPRKVKKVLLIADPLAPQPLRPAPHQARSPRQDRHTC